VHLHSSAGLRSRNRDRRPARPPESAGPAWVPGCRAGSGIGGERRPSRYRALFRFYALPPM